MKPLRTEIKVKPLTQKISYSDFMIMFGSCFSENIGNRLLDLRFDIMVNPYGILYNPLSIEKSISEIINNKIYSEEDLVLYNDKWHSLNHHSSFSDIDNKKCLSKINNKISEAKSFIEKSSYVFITLGSSIVYFDINTDEVVGNCHKIPANEFYTKRLNLNETSESLSNIIELLRSKNKELSVIFTVSPIRHWKNGAIENQLSKATLLLAIDDIIKNYDDIIYFPAFEIMNDDLRDYRFYAEDMLHPNNLAIEYIWELFSNEYICNSSYKAITAIDKLNMAMRHRVNDTNTTEYKKHQQFIERKKKEVEELLAMVKSSSQ